VLILALDTTTRAGSVALVRDGVVCSERQGDPARTHGQRLPGDVMAILDAAALKITDIELFAVAVGPGSFTGLRVGIATIQGLATACGRNVVPVSALDGLARTVGHRMRGERLVATWMDGQRGEVFAALYDADGRTVLEEHSAETPSATLARWRDRRTLDSVSFVGDGAVRYADAIHGVLGPAADILPASSLAGVLGLIAAENPARAVSPHAVVPLYIRRPDAELARVRRLAAGTAPIRPEIPHGID
jgi:tRNA threonylcarbamoyladenosine biosynthesis protein TsaB